MLKLDGHDNAILGRLERFGMEPIICYSKEKVLENLLRDNMTLEEAYEWYEFNMVGAWVGDGTPCFLDSTPCFECEEAPAVDEGCCQACWDKFNEKEEGEPSSNSNHIQSATYTS